MQSWFDRMLTNRYRTCFSKINILGSSRAQLLSACPKLPYKGNLSNEWTDLKLISWVQIYKVECWSDRDRLYYFPIRHILFSKKFKFLGVQNGDWGCGCGAVSRFLSTVSHSQLSFENHNTSKCYRLYMMKCDDHLRQHWFTNSDISWLRKFSFSLRVFWKQITRSTSAHRLLCVETLSER